MEFEENINKRNIKNKPTSLNTNIKSKVELIQKLINGIKKVEEKKSEILLIVDRIEGRIAVCENRETQEITNIDLNDLPKNVKEGDALRYENREYEIDVEARKEIEDRIKNKLKNLFD